MSDDYWVLLVGHSDDAETICTVVKLPTFGQALDLARGWTGREGGNNSRLVGEVWWRGELCVYAPSVTENPALWDYTGPASAGTHRWEVRGESWAPAEQRRQAP